MCNAYGMVFWKHRSMYYAEVNLSLWKDHAMHEAHCPFRRAKSRCFSLGFAGAICAFGGVVMTDAWMIMASIVFALVSAMTFVWISMIEAQEDQERLMLEELIKLIRN
jgi:hypothetical protein